MVRMTGASQITIRRNFPHAQAHFNFEFTARRAYRRQAECLRLLKPNRDIPFSTQKRALGRLAKEKLLINRQGVTAMVTPLLKQPGLNDLATQVLANLAAQREAYPSKIEKPAAQPVEEQPVSPAIDRTRRADIQIVQRRGPTTTREDEQATFLLTGPGALDLAQEREETILATGPGALAEEIDDSTDMSEGPGALAADMDETELAPTSTRNTGLISLLRLLRFFWPF